MEPLELVHEVGDTGLEPVGSLDKVEAADCSLEAVAGCSSPVEEPVFAELSSCVLRRRADTPVERLSRLQALYSGNTDSKHSKSMPRWKR